MADAMSNQGVATPDAGYLNAESRRSLDNATYASNRVVTVQVPRDTVLKRMGMRMTYISDVTYAAGSPVFGEFGIFGRVCPQIELTINGNRVVKSVQPHMLRCEAILGAAGMPRRAYTFGAAAPTSTRASREWMAATLAYPATTQYVLFNEQVPMHFELPPIWGAANKQDTELDIRDVSSADLKFYFAAQTALLRDGNSATVTYANTNTYVKTQVIENRAKPRPQPGQALFDYVQYTIQKNIAGQSKGVQTELQTGNYLAGLSMLCRDGDANQQPSDNILTGVTLKVNGSSAVQGPVDFQELQDDNVARYGGDDMLGIADYASSIASTASAHPLKGFAFMNLLRNSDWNTAINTSRSSGVDTIKLEVDSASSSGNDAATYTNNVQLIIGTHEIRPFVFNR